MRQIGMQKKPTMIFIHYSTNNYEVTLFEPSLIYGAMYGIGLTGMPF